MHFDDKADHASYTAVAAAENPDGLGQIVLAIIECKACSFAFRLGLERSIGWAMN
jgi:hypothetical protein